MDIHQIPEVLRELERSEFYGSLELKYERGMLVLVRKTETYRPDLETRGKRVKEAISTTSTATGTLHFDSQA